MLLPSLCCCLPSAGIDHSARTVQSHFARCRQGATGHPGNPQRSLKDCPDIPCQHGRNESLHYDHPTWDQWQMGTCEFFPTLQVSVGGCHCSITEAPGSGLFTLQLPSHAYCWAFFFFLSFVFGSVAMCLESGRHLSYKCLRDVWSLLLALFIMKDAKLKALRFSVLSWPDKQVSMACDSVSFFTIRPFRCFTSTAKLPSLVVILKEQLLSIPAVLMVLATKQDHQSEIWTGSCNSVNMSHQKRKWWMEASSGLPLPETNLQHAPYSR